MANTRPEHGDLHEMGLEAGQLAELIGTTGECVFNWTTRTGYPIGVVVRCVYRDGTFWTTSVAGRVRIKALRARPESAIVLNSGGRTATFKGRSVLHETGDPDWDVTKRWFFRAMAGTDRHPDDPVAQRIERSLDNPEQVIVETPAALVVSFDFAKFSEHIASS